MIRPLSRRCSLRMPSAGVLASVLLAACGDGPSQPKVRIPSAVTAATPAATTAAVGTVVTPAPAVTVRDARGPLPNITVTFAAAGGGTVEGATVKTAANGLATVGRWTLGTSAAVQTLTATVEGVQGLAPAEFTATATPGPAVSIAAVEGGVPTAAVGTALPASPAVTVRDQYGNPIGGRTVTFAVTAGGGSITGGTAITDAAGRAAVGSWTLGTATGSNALRAMLDSLGTTITVDAVAGPPASMTVVAGLDQIMQVGTALPVAPAVRVRDQYGNPVVGKTVTFAAAGGGTATAATPATDATGTAAVGAWAMGPTEGLNTLTATIDGLPGLAIQAKAVPTSAFHVTLRYLTPATPRQRAAFERAAERWRKVVIGDLADVPANGVPADFCGRGEPALDEVIDDVLVYVEIAPIDGPGEVLGSAGPCAARGANGLPVLGIMHFDAADVAELEASNQLDDVILHEMGHVFGLGVLWNYFGLLASAGTSDPYYMGDGGRSAFSIVGGAAYLGTPVPVENVGGPGTQDAHWRNAVLRTELMTGYAEQPGVRMPLSLVTIGAMADLGYTVTTWGDDWYEYGVDLRRGARSPGRAFREGALPKPLAAIDASGRPVPAGTGPAAFRRSARPLPTVSRRPVQQLEVHRP